MEFIERAIKLKTELDALRPIGKEQMAIVMQKFRLEWNYHSNHLEGNSLTFGETKALILEGLTSQGKPLKDSLEILGHNEAVNWIIEIVNGDYPLTENFIRQLHSLLLKEPYEVTAETPDGKPTKKRVEVGKYKTLPNHVKTSTGEIFRFATPEETPAVMHGLIEWYRNKSQEADVNPIILAAEFHYRFIRIHPFDDGNGRVARLLMNFILMKYGYPPVIIKSEDKLNYFFSLRQADAGDIESFVEYIAKNLVRSIEIIIAGAKGESIEEPTDLDKEIALLEQRLNSVGNKIEIKKSKESIIDIYDNSINKIAQLLINACEKFEKFYVESFFLLYVDEGYDTNKYEAIKLQRRHINKNTNSVLLVYKFKSFNRVGFDGFNYRIEIKFNFHLSGYNVTDIVDNKLIDKQYGNQLSEKEINEIVKKEIKSHQDFIEMKLKDIEKKRG